MRIRSLLVPILVLGLAFSIVSTAWAAAPPSGPAVQAGADFETSSLLVDTNFNPYGASASLPTWGLTTGRAHSGAHGFWCAASGGAAVGSYPAGTHGMAYLGVPAATNWVESTVNFSYFFPSVRGGESNPFTVSWVPTSKAATASLDPSYYGRNAWGALDTNWHTISIKRGDLVDGGIMAKDAGWLRFDFTSDPNLSGSAEGVTIDDVSVSGYEFNAVNNLAANRIHGDLSTVTVTWTAPTAASGSGPDARTIYYRIWREDMSTAVWTQVRTVGTTSTSFNDTGVPVGGTYKYEVVGYQAASGDVPYGKFATSASVSPAITRFVSPSATPNAVAYGGLSTVSGTLLDENSQPITGVQNAVVLQQSIGGGAWTTLAGVANEVSAGAYSIPVNSTVSSDYRLLYTGAGSSVWSDPVHVAVTPLGSIRFTSSSVAPSVVAYGGGSTVTGALVDGNGAPLTGAGADVVVQQRIGNGSWATVGNTTEVSAGTYSANVNSIVSADYRLFYATHSTASETLHVSAGAYLSAPVTPGSVKHSKKFNVTGKVSGVPGIARTVTLRAYQKVLKKKKTTWVLRASTTVTVGGGSGVLSYTRSNWSLKLKGTYQLIASVSDVYSSSTTSGPRTFAVK